MPKTQSDTPLPGRATTPSPRTAGWTDPQWQASLDVLEARADRLRRRGVLSSYTGEYEVIQ